MTEKAYAKINLTLEIVGKKENFHMLESIVVPINLYDTLTFFLSDKDEVISNVYIEDNNILKTIRLFKETYNINEYVKVVLDKQIPIGGGLGGSSADISATLRGLNRLFRLNKPFKELEILANKLGSDTLFCLYNKRSFMYGRGDYLRLYESKEKLSFLLILPQVSLLTKDVFKGYSLLKEKPKYIGFENCLKNNEMDFIIDNTKNDLLKPALSLNSEFNKLYDNLKNSGLKIHMSGSGPSLFMINPTKKDLEKIKNIQKDVKILMVEEL